MKKFVFILLLILSAVLLLNCSQKTPLQAGGTEDGNPAIAGVVLDENGNALSEVEVTLIPKWYQPRDSLGVKGLVSTKTDEDGQYEFSHIQMDTYNVVITDEKLNKSAIVQDVVVEDLENTIHLGETTVQDNATLLIVLDGITEEEGGVVYIPGTPYYVTVDSVQVENGVLEINNLPPVNFDTIFFSQDFLEDPNNILEDTVKLNPDSTLVLPSKDTFNFKATVRFNTSAITLSENLINYPLVIRLNETNFNFDSTLPAGADLQFLNMQGDTLPHEFEWWNKVQKQAVIWVLMDTLFHNKIEQSIQMRWGREKPVKKSEVVFDTSNGFGAVYHLGENPAGDKVNSIKDATPNELHGSPLGGMKGNDLVLAAIGRGIDLSDNLDGIYPSSPDPGFYHDPNTEYTMSAWFNPGSSAEDTSVIFDIGGKTNGFVLAYDAVNEKALFGINSETTSIHRVTSTTDIKKGGDGFYFVTGVYKNDSIHIYVNGVKEASKFHRDPVPYHPDSPGIGRVNQCSFIFRDSAKVCDESKSEWNGIVDELRASNQARSDDWILMNFISQEPKSNFITVIESQ